MTSHFIVAAEPRLGIRDVHSFKETLESALRHNASVEIDVAGLLDTDISIVQVILSAQKMAANLGRGFIVSAPPGSVFKDVLQRAGFIPSRPNAPALVESGNATP